MRVKEFLKINKGYFKLVQKQYNMRKKELKSEKKYDRII